MTEWTEELLTRATGMKRAGIRLKDIATRLGVSPSALYQQMRRRGVRTNLLGQGKRNIGPPQRILFTATFIDEDT